MHSSLFFAGSYFTFSQICVVVQKARIHHLGPAADRNMEIVRQLEQVFERYRMMFKKLKRKGKKAARTTLFLQTKKTLKKIVK
jgi:hypothetical protein